MPPKISLLKLTSPQAILDLYENKHVVQDMLVPFSSLKKSLEFFHDQIEVRDLLLNRLPVKNLKLLSTKKLLNFLWTKSCQEARLPQNK